jgi:hypothetical protein
MNVGGRTLALAGINVRAGVPDSVGPRQKPLPFAVLPSPSITKPYEARVPFGAQALDQERLD